MKLLSVITFIFRTQFGQPLFSCTTRLKNEYLPTLMQEGLIICKILKFPLNHGSYFINILIKQGMDNSNMLDCIEQAAHFQVVEGDFYGTGRSPSSQNSAVLVEHFYSEKTK
jgi:hypothetical protein